MAIGSCSNLKPLTREGHGGSRGKPLNLDFEEKDSRRITNCEMPIADSNDSIYRLFSLCLSHFGTALCK